MDFYDRYENLCKERNLSPQSKILLDAVGVSSGTVTGWKKGSTPNFDAVVKIADYFQVDIRYLLGLTDTRHGEDMIEEVTEYIRDAGFDVHQYESENGSGKEYVIENAEGSVVLQEQEYRDLCREILTEINTAKFDIVVEYIRNHFKTFQSISSVEKPDPDFTLSPEEQTLIEKYRQLDADGKIILQSTIISELRRMK